MGPSWGSRRPKEEAHRLVHGGGVGDAVLHDGDGLPPEGVLHAVGDEAGHVLLHSTGFLPTERSTSITVWATSSLEASDLTTSTRIRWPGFQK